MPARKEGRREQARLLLAACKAAPLPAHEPGGRALLTKLPAAVYMACYLYILIPALTSSKAYRYHEN